MAVGVDFELLERLKEALMAEIEDHGISEKDLALLLEDNPNYINNAVETLAEEVYDLINDYVSDTVESDISEIVDAQPESGEDSPNEEELTTVDSGLAVDYDEKIEWNKK